MSLRILVAVWVSAAVSLESSGCGDSTHSASTGSPPPRTVVYRALFTDWKQEGVPIQGLTVEVVDRPDLATVVTDASGIATIPGLTPGEVVIVRWRKDGYQCAQRLMRVGNGDLDERNELMLTDAWIDNYEEGLPYEVDQTKGFIEFAVRDAQSPDDYLDGITVTSSPATSDVCYYDQTGDCTDPQLEGQLTLHNLPPGPVDLTFANAHGDMECTTENPETDWTLGAIQVDDEPNTFETELEGGCESFVRVYCEML